MISGPSVSVAVRTDLTLIAQAVAVVFTGKGAR